MNAISKQPRWTFEESEVLRENYRTLGQFGCMDLLPGRSRNAIRKRACEMGLTNPELTTQPNKEPSWPLPACDLIESRANVRLRKWAREIKPNPRFGVAMIGGGYV